jgi:hypothetical protein
MPRRFPRLDTSKWTRGMIQQALRSNFDNHFRFPREHIQGKSLSDFSEMELVLMRAHRHAIWEIYWKKASKMAARDRPPWTEEIKQVCSEEIDIIKELRRRHES